MMNQGYYDRRGDKRKRSRSRSPVREQWGGQQPQPWSDPNFNSSIPRTGTEQYETHNDNSLALDLYNSDLNLIIDKSQFSAKPLTTDGFAFMWAGARATHGARQGKVCYEVKVLQQLDVSHLPPEEINPHVVRLGWSLEKTSMQLGEEPDSWGYGGTGKSSTNCKFKDYGVPFMQGDTVTCYLNADSNPVEISYAKNGRHLGIAYRIPREQIGEQALYPHILSKNCEFFVNFGQLPQPLFPLSPGYDNYTFISCAPMAWLERGTLPPTKKEDCEMIMMCGLPGAGKTTWAINYSALHPDKKYNLLGTNSIIDKMKVMGLPRKRNYAGRWDVLIQKSTKCLNKLLEMGSHELRNYILDQTNVYPSAQKRKMRPFEGFKKKAVVLVPTDEEFMRRCNKRESEEGKDVPDSAVLEMKANFGLPTVGPIFDDVIYVELPKEEAEPLVKQYNEEGQAAVGPQQKRFCPNNQQNIGESNNRSNWDGGRGDGRSGGRGRGQSRGGYRGDNFSSGGGDRGGYRGGQMSGGGDRGGGDRGGFRGDNMPYGGGGDRDGYRGGSMSGGGDRDGYRGGGMSGGGDRDGYRGGGMSGGGDRDGYRGGGMSGGGDRGGYRGTSSPAGAMGDRGGYRGPSSPAGAMGDRGGYGRSDSYGSPPGSGMQGGNQNWNRGSNPYQSSYGQNSPSQYGRGGGSSGSQSMQDNYNEQRYQNPQDQWKSAGRGGGYDQGGDQYGYGGQQSNYSQQDQSRYGQYDQPSRYGQHMEHRDQPRYGQQAPDHSRDPGGYNQSYGRDQQSGYGQNYDQSDYNRNYEQSQGPSSYGQQSYGRSSYGQGSDQAQNYNQGGYGQQHQYGQSDYNQQYQQYGYQQQQQPPQSQGYGGYGQYK